MGMTDLRIAHVSMQFSDTAAEHERDCKTVFAYAKSHRIVFLSGTEGTRMRTHLGTYAGRSGYQLNWHKSGEWVAVNKQLAEVSDTGWVGPLIPGTVGLKAAQGAHAPRGICWTTAKVPEVGTVTVGSVHFLTQRSIRGSGHTNQPLIDGIAKWGRDKGAGKALVVINGDVNLNDQRLDVFKGKPFKTVWDELRKWPGTHNTKDSGTIDISASYDHDGRVSAKSAQALDDSQLRLGTDHFMILATYRVK